jgi:hypothetical protein
MGKPVFLRGLLVGDLTSSLGGGLRNLQMPDRPMVGRLCDGYEVFAHHLDPLRLASGDTGDVLVEVSHAHVSRGAEQRSAELHQGGRQPSCLLASLPRCFGDGAHRLEVAPNCVGVVGHREGEDHLREVGIRGRDQRWREPNVRNVIGHGLFADRNLSCRCRCFLTEKRAVGLQQSGGAAWRLLLLQRERRAGQCIGDRAPLRQPAPAIPLPRRPSFAGFHQATANVAREPRYRADHALDLSG